MRRTFVDHLAFLALGYAIAVLVSVTITCAVMGLPTVLPDNGRGASFYSFWRDFPNLFFGGLSITALYALPGWLMSVIAAEIRKEQRRYWFAAAGVLTALLALLLAAKGGSLLSIPVISFGSLIGGFFGGLAYWTIAGRRSGDWRRRLELSVPADPVDKWTLK